MPILSPFQIIVVVAVMALAAMIQGSTGFGLALVAVPPLHWINPIFAPAPLLLATPWVSILTWRRDRASLDFKGLFGALVGRIPGAMAGAALLATTSPKTLSLVIGGLILAAVGISACGVHVAPTRRHVFLAGMVSGVMGTISAVGGPPMALIYQKEEAARMRGTLAAYFSAGAIISLIALIPAGRLGQKEFGAALILLPGAAIGFYLSSFATRFFSKNTLRLAVLIIAALGGLTIVLSSLT